MTYYTKQNNNFYYMCPFCYEEHIITDEYYSYHIFMKNIDIQEQCQNCNSTLFLESRIK